MITLETGNCYSVILPRYRIPLTDLRSIRREHNMVRFRDGKPTGIYFSQHSDGAAYQWGDAALSKEDERVSQRGYVQSRPEQ